MNYINPYELLGLATEDVSAAKKQKNKLLAEIELSDSQIVIYNGSELTKSDCINAIDDLDNKDKRDFHFFIYQHDKLLNFLTRGELDFFFNYQAESIYKIPEFIEFISPFFSERYNTALLNNVKKKNLTNLYKIVAVKPIVNDVFLEKCFQGTYLFLKQNDNDINNIRHDIKNGDSTFIAKQFEALNTIIISKYVDVRTVNILPSYFQGIRNRLAESINDLSTVIFNEPYHAYKPAFQLMEIAQDIATDGLTEQKINKDYFFVKDALDDDRNRKVRDTITDKFIILVNQIVAHLEKIDKNQITASQTYAWAKSAIDTSYINALDSSFQDEKNQIALGLKAISVNVWNKFDDLNCATDILTIALQIKTTDPTYSELQTAKTKLNEISRKGSNLQPQNLYRAATPVRTPDRSVGKKPIQKKEKNHAGAVVAVILIFVVAIIAFNVNSSSNNSSYTTNSYTTPSSYETSSGSNQASNALPPSPSPAPAEIQHPYVYKKMVTGTIKNCPNIKQIYDYDIKNELNISVGNYSNAAIKLVNVETNKTIRYVYISKGSSYVIGNIPQGKYYLKIGYGDDWGREENESSCKERFVTNSLYKKSEQILDYNLTDEGDGHFQIPSYSLTLNVHSTESSDGTSSTLNSNSISQNDFNDE